MGDKKNKGTYVVKSGDNLSAIARKQYGGGVQAERMFAEIQRANPWYNGVLQPGQVLKLPGKRNNPFVSNTLAAAAGMQGGTAETGYGFSGPRAGELNALSAGVRDTGRSINPNTPWGFNQATNLAKQYYGQAGSAAGTPIPATPPINPVGPPVPAGPTAPAAVQPTYQTNAQPGTGQANAMQPKPLKQTPVQGPPAQNKTVVPPSQGAFANQLNPTMQSAFPKVQGPPPPSPQSVGITPNPISQPDIYQHGSYQVNQQKAATLYQSFATDNPPSVISGSDFANLAMSTGIPMETAASNLLAQGFQFDHASQQFYKPDQKLNDVGMPSLGLGEMPSDFVGLPPVTVPTGYGPPRPVYSNSGRSRSGLATPALVPEVGNATASWNIGP